MTTRMSLQDRMVIADVVAERLEVLPNDLPWTMIITREKSGDCYASIVIGTSSVSIDDQPELPFSQRLPVISRDRIPVW